MARRMGNPKHGLVFGGFPKIRGTVLGVPIRVTVLGFSFKGLGFTGLHFFWNMETVFASSGSF